MTMISTLAPGRTATYAGSHSVIEGLGLRG